MDESRRFGKRQSFELKVDVWGKRVDSVTVDYFGEPIKISSVYLKKHHEPGFNDVSSELKVDFFCKDKLKGVGFINLFWNGEFKHRRKFVFDQELMNMHFEDTFTSMVDNILVSLEISELSGLNKELAVTPANWDEVMGKRKLFAQMYDHESKDLILRVVTVDQAKPILYNVHKSLLVEVSTVVEAYLSEDTGFESVLCAFDQVFGDISQCDVDCFLKFLYGTLTVEELTVNRTGLLEIGTFWDVEPLVDLVVSSLVLDVGADNAMSRLGLGDRLSLTAICDACYEYLGTHKGIYDVEVSDLAAYYNESNEESQKRFINYFRDKPEYKTYLKRNKIHRFEDDRYGDMP